MTQAIEDLITALTISEWPRRNPYSQCAWEGFSGPQEVKYRNMPHESAKATHVVDGNFGNTNQCMALGPFNPMAYLTILQVTARATGSPWMR